MRVRLPVVIALLLVAGCSSSAKPSAATPSAAGPTAAGPTAASPTTAPAGTTAGGPALTIASFKYDPSPLKVSPGAKVAVTNSDSAKHTVSSDTSGLFLADSIASGTPVTFTAPTKPGTYSYHCAYHSSMHGKLVVS